MDHSINVLLKTKRIQGHGRQFCADWFKNYSWLMLCTTQSVPIKVDLSVSYSSPQLWQYWQATQNAFNCGFDNWKKAVDCLNQHAHTQKLYLKLSLAGKLQLIIMDTQIKRSQQIN